MYKIKFTGAYKQSRKLMEKRGLNISLLVEIVTKLANGEKLEEKHNDHALSGKFKGYKECHIKPNWLLIYYIENDILVLVDTGTHSDLFDM